LAVFLFYFIENLKPNYFCIEKEIFEKQLPDLLNPKENFSPQAKLKNRKIQSDLRRQIGYVGKKNCIID